MKAPDSIARLGDIMQMAYVPRDFEQTLKFWTNTMGVAPFFSIEHVKLECTRYLGQPVEIDFSMMLGYWRNTQIRADPAAQRCSVDFQDLTRRRPRRSASRLHPHRRHENGPRPLQSWRRVSRAGSAGAGRREVVYVDTEGGPGSPVKMLKPAPGTREFLM